MKKNKTKPEKIQHGSMLNQKTNEDFNKKKPDPTDPNEVKSIPIPIVQGVEIKKKN